MLDVAYFGPPGTFTEMALGRLLDSPHRPPALADAGTGAVETIPLGSPAAVIAAVRSGAVGFGCVPMESSVEGSVPATMDALATGEPVQIFAETVLDISFTVAAVRAGQPVQTIAAYPVAAGQARESIEQLYPQAHVIPAASNAAAAQDVAQGRADAALTTALAASLHGLTTLADGVADMAGATTRFVLLGTPAPLPARTGNDRTSMVLDLPNRPASLVRAMNEFAMRSVDLTRIESRPRRDRAGYYYFFLDAAGHLDDEAMAQALAAVHAYADRVTFLGSWPADRDNGATPPDSSAASGWIEQLRRGER
ncbi:prephenate dehydratase [Williamsia sp. CHRR-6]|uniref:prephenate dehydratase n=1 Tax=Williamsia sp. CHRR-6 TaxID=2835871 RepID=UPI001BDAD195|nr:prephenate dehydratase [Williamsia sp. CHRR-6]MBT0567622.1 prephenate dehydratase [Williamsia sp. CHRR-6]